MTLSDLSEHDIEFLAKNASAAMITIGDDGLPKTARVGVGIIDGRLWSSGTRDRSAPGAWPRTRGARCTCTTRSSSG